MLVKYTLRNNTRVDWSVHYGNRAAGLYLGQALSSLLLRKGQMPRAEFHLIIVLPRDR